MSKTIAIIKGDGIGPEIMQATLRVLDAIDCNLQYDFVEAGLEALQQHGQLMPPASIETIAKHGVAFKGPLTTPTHAFCGLHISSKMECAQKVLGNYQPCE